MRVTNTKAGPRVSDEADHDAAQQPASSAPRARKSDRRFGLKPQYIPAAKQLCELGGTNADLAKAFSVGHDTIALWQSIDRGFAEACRIGTDLAENRVERAIYERAVGYVHKAETVVRDKHGVSIVRYKVHVPADPGAAKLWLERRQADQAQTRESPIQEFWRQLQGTALRPKMPE